MEMGEKVSKSNYTLKRVQYHIYELHSVCLLMSYKGIAESTILRRVLRSPMLNTHLNILVRSGENSHVPIHNTQSIWTTNRGCT